MKAYCVVLAGGAGVRMGGKTPKQFLTLGGEPIVVRTVRSVLRCVSFARVAVVYPGDWQRQGEDALAAGGIDRSRVVVVRGGESRNESTMRGLEALRADGAADDDVAVVCDGVRPFVSLRLLEDCISETKRHGACIAAVPAIDSMLEVEDGRIVAVPRRARLFHGQTPCGAFVGVLERALRESAASGGGAAGTAQLLFESGIGVSTFPGDQLNFKITTVEDLRRAESVLSRQTENGLRKM